MRISGAQRYPVHNISGHPHVMAVRFLAAIAETTLEPRFAEITAELDMAFQAFGNRSG